MVATIAPSSAATLGDQFDVMIADAKASMLNDPRVTIAKAKAAETSARALPLRRRTIATATAKWLQGEAYLRLNDLKRAEPFIEQALGVVSQSDAPTRLKGDILLSRGGLHTATARVAMALDDYQRAHNIFQNIEDVRSQAISLLSIALLYQEANDYQNALKYYEQALDVYRGDPQLLLSIYNNKGNALKEIGQFSQAETQFGEALSIAKTMGSPALEAQIMRNIARSQLLDGRLEAAERTIAAGLTMTRRSGEAQAAQQFWSVAAQAALQDGRLRDAAQLISRSFLGVNVATTTLSYRESHQTAYQIFKRLGDEMSALRHLEALKRLEDQTSKLAASANTALAAARFDYANQELRIAKLRASEARRTLENERARAQLLWSIFIGIAVITVIIVAMLAFGLVTIRRSRNQVRAANIDLAATNDALGKALAAKTEFLATTSHEIRTPLNGILGMTQVMLADHTLGAAMRDRIGVVHGAGVTMRALVDDILDVAKMETGNLTIEQAPLDLKATLRDVCRLWEEQARAKGVGFTLDLDGCPDRIEGDAARLRQVIFNLLSNALKFTETGSVGLSAATSGAGDGARLRIAVSDSGIGIPADKLELIFESFRQVDAGTTRRFGGTGLGLSICRSLAQAMGGGVLVHSTPGVGSVFTLDLPLIAATEAVAAAEVEASAPALLILDRNPITRAMLRTVLEPRAGAVVVAATVDEALEKLAKGGIAQVVVDDATIRTAADVAAALSSLAAFRVPVALLWASPDDAQRHALLRCGVDRVIAKPISGVALADILYYGPRSDHIDVCLATQAA